MSIVISPPPLVHQPFSENDLYPSSSSSGSTPPSDAVATPSSRDTLIPFPVFQHRHSSPYPTTHSFSALGPPPAVSPPKPTIVLGTIPPPAAPKSQQLDLPGLTPEGSTMQQTLPPTPDPSPPNSKVLFPDVMVKLAPPADDSHALGLDVRSSDDIPRRMPLVSVDQITSAPTSPESTLRKKSHSHLRRGKGDVLSPRPKSMGPPARPMRRSQTAIHPSSIRMAESSSADSRARERSSNRAPSGQLLAYSSRSNSPGLPRALTAPIPDASSAAIRATSIDSTANDMGGLDGLEAKVVLLGSQGVGKTSLILRYTTRLFSPHPAAATIGSSLHTRKLVQDGVRVKLQIWDTAGQERFRSMAPIYYRGAHVCVLVYDVSDRQSFEDVRSWLEELGRTVPKETVIYVVGSKIDLESQRVITQQEAHFTIRQWLKPPTPPRPELLSPASTRSIFRSSSMASRTETPTAPASILTSPAPTRSHSHTALTTLSSITPTIPPPKPAQSVNAKKGKPFPVSPAAKKAALQITTLPQDPRDVGSPRSRRISFPALQSPTLPTSVTFLEPVKPSITPASPSSRHGASGGRFSISGMMGYNQRTSIGGAASELARLAENFPASPRQPVSAHTSIRSQSFGSETPTRMRTESSPTLDNRRKSEDWSSRSWRMGEGPGAAEALGEFGAGVKKKQSGELLAGKMATVPLASGPSGSKKGRARGGSLGRDSRLYGGDGSDASDEEFAWGVEVEGMRVGDVSALTGEGVEALFRSISALLVDKRENIERERTLRRKDSVMLTDPAKDAKEAKGRTRGCCA